MYVAFKEVIVANAQCFPFESRAEFHVYMGGNHGGFNECMRATDGVCLYIGPEAKVMLDPKFPWSGIANVVQFVDMPRLLECASGGAYVWDTATEAKAARLRAAQAAEVAHELKLPWIIGGGGGYYYSARRMAVYEQKLQQSLTMARAEGAVDTVRLLRSDLLSAMEDALNREKLWRPLAGVRDRLKGTLSKITPDVPRVDGTSARATPSVKRAPAAVSADLDAARVGIKGAVNDLAKLQLERLKVQTLVGALQRDAVAGTREVAGIARETTRLRAGLGQVYAELARQAAARGDAAEARRLLITATAVDPAGRDRYTKTSQKKAPEKKKQK